MPATGRHRLSHRRPAGPSSASPRPTGAGCRCESPSLEIPRSGVYFSISTVGVSISARPPEGMLANALLADALGAAVVSVDYRLAPEFPWPAAPDDCETAALWLVEHAESVFGTSTLAISGLSSGANLAAATLLRLRARDSTAPFVGAVLQFGVYDLSGQSPGGRLYGDEFFIDAYAGVADRTDPDISPLYGDLRGLPPTLLVVGSLDIVLEDNVAMAERLSAAGNEVDLRVYPESTHGFTAFPTAMAANAMRYIESWLADHLAEK